MKQIKLAVLALLMIAPLAQAEMRIGVIDSEKAVLTSDAAKRYEKESETAFAPRVKILDKIQGELKELQNRLNKDGPTLSEAQLEARKIEMQRKYEDFKRQEGQLRSEKARADQAELGKLKPKLDAAIEKVSTEMKFDLVLERRVAHFVKPEFDITRKVIEQLNQAK